MIDPREIRSGNWVIKVTGTDVNMQSFFEYKTIAVDEYNYTFSKVCFPIKITPAILEKSSFIHEFGDWSIKSPHEGVDAGLLFLSFRHNEGWYLGKIKLWAQPIYLHQLQNLFYALTNEELGIHLEGFENSAMSGPINFFIKLIKKNYPIEELL
jgi:hypothetical protein